jgi:hypothetical protein
MILALMAAVRATHPSILKPGADGFTLDFEAFDRNTSFNSDEQLLLKLRAVMDSPASAETPSLAVELSPGEGKRLAEMLERLEKLQPWPADVLALSLGIRARLIAIK